MKDIEKLIIFNEEREKFRDFADYYGFLYDCIIDKNDYCSYKEIDGCFYKDGFIVVYSTDDNGEIVYEKVYTKPIDAFRELARRNGYNYMKIEKVRSL